ncbi:MAG: hypothetical protein LBN95_05150 [Prevotellaceae bacterium]|jgi:hypothetical protein|nr:hypothetical protein [Prevotellaceae bacterium]
MNNTEQFNIGYIVCRHLQAEGRNVTWLCRKIHWQRKKYYRFLYNGQIEVHDLQKISVLLHYDFLKYFSLPPADQTQQCGK